MLRFSPIEQIARKILKGVLVMPTIVYCYSEPVVCEISAEEYERRSNMPRVIEEETGRMARRYIREYDEIHAEMLGEKDARRAKYMRTHGKDKTPKDRKRDKQNRNYRMYGREEQWASFRFIPEDPLFCRGGWDWYCGREGQKNPMNPEMDIFRNRRREDRERSLLKDFEIEQKNIADTMEKYAYYCIMAEQHEQRLECLRNLTGPVEFWELMADDISLGKIYEEQRIREIQNIADNIMRGEYY